MNLLLDEVFSVNNFDDFGNFNDFFFNDLNFSDVHLSGVNLNDFFNLNYNFLDDFLSESNFNNLFNVFLDNFMNLDELWNDSL